MSRFYLWDAENQQLVPWGIFHLIHDFSLIQLEEDLTEPYTPMLVTIPLIYNKLAVMTDEIEVVEINPLNINLEDNFALPAVTIPKIYNELSVLNEEWTIEFLDPSLTSEVDVSEES